MTEILFFAALLTKLTTSLWFLKLAPVRTMISDTKGPVWADVVWAGTLSIKLSSSAGRAISKVRFLLPLVIVFSAFL
ncbi:hypothetical protein D3C71_1943870 [compost metagenome]